ncbi:hypothetical protein [Streptomyces sp. NPDC087300]|uniref:hypothetical protein n=1 Tax=Streptomyces sp. NPDC087300 TaxID=3365780 RepID=UPI003800E858
MNPNLRKPHRVDPYRVDPYRVDPHRVDPPRMDPHRVNPHPARPRPGNPHSTHPHRTARPGLTPGREPERLLARSGPVAVALTCASGVLLAAVTAAPPSTAYLICGALLGASATAVGFALTGWGACSRRAAGGGL